MYIYIYTLHKHTRKNILHLRLKLVVSKKKCKKKKNSPASPPKKPASTPIPLEEVKLPKVTPETNFCRKMFWRSWRFCTRKEMGSCVSRTKKVLLKPEGNLFRVCRLENSSFVWVCVCFQNSPKFFGWFVLIGCWSVFFGGWFNLAYFVSGKTTKPSRAFHNSHLAM